MALFCLQLEATPTSQRSFSVAVMTSNVAPDAKPHSH